MEKKKIVVIGGGGGASMILEGLREAPTHIEISSIVPMADNGGSTGRLMADYHTSPVGDITLHLLASARDKAVRDLLAIRFGGGCLQGHTVRNILLTAKALEGTEGFESGIDLLARLLNARCTPIASTLEHVDLRVRYGKEQKELVGEHEIEVSPPLEEPRVFDLIPHDAKANPRAVEAIANADLVVFSPGSIFGSLLPVLFIKDLAEAISKTQGKVLMVANLVNNTQEDTIRWTAQRFIQEIESHLHGRKIDRILLQTEPIPSTTLSAGLSGTEQVAAGNLSDEQKEKLITGNFLLPAISTTQAGDTVLRNPLKHDAQKVSDIILSLL